MRPWRLILLFILFTAPVWAADQAVENRMLNIASELRCLVCQNESIAASQADLAVDLRQQIREQIRAGKSNDDIRAYMVDRYGDFVLYRPPLKPTTMLLWFGPFLLLVFGFLILVLSLRNRNRKSKIAALNEEERRQADALLAPANNVLDES
ncbi:cytochrome c-type biogenesis protein [Achromobacter anxifer]|uniref:cytochrome c-type biogenesis protein n=1 Tax=Achromobacter anxifer TaxID=1287737 RepID=UPI0023FA035E|nr:cytochrome c-type biogenesis protein [Achromobacter anxifer]MDF8361268.1 cytochrome c-type biogenesis protein CcmH [Achromobacter anxifer]